MFLAVIEKISIGESFALAGIAICIIMAVLACIMGLIYLMSFLFKQLDKLKAKKTAQKAASAPETAATPEPVAPGSCGDLVLVDCSERDAAMIMAIVADSTETPLNELRFRSIKLIKDMKESNI